MKSSTLLLLAALFLCCSAKAQDPNRPAWLDHLPKARNATYTYKIEYGEGLSVSGAVNQAILKVLKTTMISLGVSVNMGQVNKALKQGSSWGDISAKYKIPINKVCIYPYPDPVRKTKEGRDVYLVAVLFQVAVRGDVPPQFDEFTACRRVSSRPDWAALAKSAVIPGLGQMGKRHGGAGFFTLMGEVVFVGGAVGSYYMANQELAVMQQSDVTFNEFSGARERYELYRYAHIGCLSAAGVLYVYNLVRAYTMTPKYKPRNLAFEPAVLPANGGVAPGVGLTLNF